MNTLAKIVRRGRAAARRRLGLFDNAGNGVLPRSMQVCDGSRCASCSKGPRGSVPFRLIYLCPGWDGPGGGIKVIYQHVEAIAARGAPCFVFHPDTPGSSYTWMPHQVVSLKLGHFDPGGDFLVFPEVWAALAAKFCIPAGIRYAIFVQNGYLAHRTAGFDSSTLAEAYRHATLVLSISNDTSEMLRLLFPDISPDRIQRVHCSVPAAFAPAAKEPLITYMPRKLRDHAERLEIYLRNHLPGPWRMQALDGMPARQVADAMGRSSIFLSFCDLEGYGLPPLEAAVCGNIVVGYTGQAAREYFERPIFREVPNGDFRLFVSEVRAAIRDVESGVPRSEAFTAQLARIAATHSAENEAFHLISFAELAYGSVCAQAALHLRPAWQAVASVDDVPAILEVV
jgi:hypothetical protein